MKRSENFSATEVEFLLAAVKKYSSILENKKTDRVSAEEKLNSWKAVEREFNSKFTNTFRSHKVLKTKYGNIKSTAKQNFAFDKRQTYATGGGPPQEKATTNVDEKILEICQEAQILGRPSSYDCDADENEYQDIEYIDEVPSEEDGAVGGKVDDGKKLVKSGEDIGGTSWTKYTPKKLQQPLNKALKKVESKDVWAKLAEKKLERQNLEMQLSKERHSVEIEKLRLEMDLIRLKIEKLRTE